MSLYEIAKLTHLVKLNLSYSMITAKGIEYLTSLNDLEEIDLTFCENLGDEALALLGKCQKLKILKIGPSHHITDKGLKIISQHKSITSIELHPPTDIMLQQANNAID